MKKEYDFTNAKRGPVIRMPASKTRITIRIDKKILDWFKKEVSDAGGGNYQTLINNALADHIKARKEPLEVTVRAVVREELAAYGKKRKPTQKN